MSIHLDLIGAILRGGLTWMSRRRLPQIEGTLVRPGLNGTVEIVRDRWGVPHIYAKDAHDLFFAQGFVHAQDRLWQMEVHRRVAQGRLSEFFGELTLDADRAARTFGFQRLGSHDLAQASSDLQGIFHAYTKGVNAFLEHADSKLPVEFSLLRHRPEPWSPEDSAAFGRVMIWQLSHAWEGEIVRAQLIQAVGKERAAELEIHYPEANPATLPSGIEFQRLGPGGELISAAGPFLARGLGSNAWTVSGRLTETGQPMLCNDMHLPLSAPCLWYEAHLDGGGFRASGVTLPGVPMVMVGHNARIAWGMTLAFTDAEDLFVEEFDPQRPSLYRHRDRWLEAEIIREPIQVKGREAPHIEEIIITRHGPVISDVVGYTQERLAVQSMSLQPTQAFRGWMLLNMAGDWDEFVEAMRLIEAPQLNVTYADVDGNIGYWVTGRVPIRAKGDGTVPAPGWRGDHEWEGEIPFEEMPHALNPSRGYIVSCNHRIVAEDYPHFLGNVWMNGYRARRLEQMIDGKNDLSFGEMRRMQMDVTCLPGLEFVRKLQDVESSDSDVQLALEILREWDGQLTPESVGGAIYEVARRTLLRDILEPHLGEKLFHALAGQGFEPILKSASEFYGHDTIILLRMLENPDSWWMQGVGGREALLSRGLQQTVHWLRTECGPKPSDWQWGRLHRVAFNHPLGLQQPLDRVFNRGPYPIGGDTDTPCQTAMRSEEPYDAHGFAPSFRQIVDLGNLSRSVVIIPMGQSGHLASAHYDDLIEPWREGEHHPMLWDRGQIEEHAEGRLILRGAA